MIVAWDLCYFSSQVVAKETGTKEKYEGRTNVTVNVINVNDNTPSFERLVYIFAVYENISTEEVAGRVKVSSDFFICKVI